MASSNAPELIFNYLAISPYLQTGPKNIKN
jgi:hypothetical protein